MLNTINSINNTFNTSYNQSEQGVTSGYNQTVGGVTSGYNKSEQGVTSGYNKSEQGVTYGYDQTSGGVTSGYNQTSGGVTSGYNKSEQGVTYGYDQTSGGVTSGYNQTSGGVTSGYNKSEQGVTYGYDQTSGGVTSGYDQTSGGAENSYNKTTNTFKKSSVKTYLLFIGIIISVFVIFYFSLRGKEGIVQNVDQKTNMIEKLNNSSTQYILLGFIMFFCVILTFTVFNGSFLTTKSKEELVLNLLMMLFSSMIIFGLFLAFLPGLKNLRTLFEQINSISYVIIYTIFAILFYSLMPSDILNTYPSIINIAMLLLGIFFYYKGFQENYIDSFNINYEKIKMAIIFVCLLMLIMTLYIINPGDIVEKYSSQAFLISFIMTIFAFLYVLITIGIGNKSTTGVYGMLIFIIFLAGIIGYVSINKSELSDNHAKTASILILVLLISILSSLALGSKIFSDPNSNVLNSNVYGIYKKGLLGVFGLVISSLLIYWLVYSVQNYSGKSGITSFILSFLLIAIILGLIYKTIFVKMPVENNKKNAFFNIILTTLLYIPCLLSGIFDWFGKLIVGQYNATDAGSFMMLFVAIGLIIAYFKTPSLFNFISSQGGKQLVNKPVYTDTEYNLGSYIDLNGSDTFDYQYAISCWVFIDAAPPNMNPNYSKFTSLLNFGNKPNILYNGSKNSLMITMKQKDLKNITKNQLIDFDDEGNRIIYINKNVLLQKWNNIIINYNGGTMDIFLNGELVKSSIEVVPYYTYDNLTIGENEGIKGGICNVVYFRNALTSSNVYYLYNSVKTRTPPVLNDSNETILIQNVNKTINSAKNVT